jgi:hypothetical protein
MLKLILPFLLLSLTYMHGASAQPLTADFIKAVAGCDTFKTNAGELEPQLERIKTVDEKQFTSLSDVELALKLLTQIHFSNASQQKAFELAASGVPVSADRKEAAAALWNFGSCIPNIMVYRKIQDRLFETSRTIPESAKRIRSSYLNFTKDHLQVRQAMLPLLIEGVLLGEARDANLIKVSEANVTALANWRKDAKTFAGTLNLNFPKRLLSAKGPEDLKSASETEFKQLSNARKSEFAEGDQYRLKLYEIFKKINSENE